MADVFGTIASDFVFAGPVSGTRTVGATIATALTFTGPVTGTAVTVGGAVLFPGTSTTTADSTVVTTDASAAFKSGGSSMIAIAPPVGRRWRLVVTDVNGVIFGELENARLSPITYELNKWETWSFQILQNDPKAALILDVPFRECQVYRGDQLLAWGPMVRTAMSKDYLVVGCVGAMWHLSRRNIGKADRTNWVTNGDFENGLAGWDLFTDAVIIASGLPEAQTQLPAAGIVTNPVVTGGRALSLRNFVNGANAGATQQFRYTVDGSVSPDGDVFTLKAYVYLDAQIAGNAPWGTRGMFLERYSTTELNPDPFVQAVIPGAALNLQTSFVPLDEDTPVGVWNRFEIELTTPPKAGVPEDIIVGLLAPANATVYWDAVSLTLIEKEAFYNWDQAAIVGNLVEHLQNPAYDKSDVNIARYCPGTGVIRTRVYIHSEHPPGLGSIEEFTQLDNGLDFDVRYTPTTRTFTTYYPRRGTDWGTGVVFELGVNIAEYTWSFDGEAAATSVVVLGSGNGSDREEGFAQNASGYSNGVTLEQVLVSPPEATIDSLDNIAAERLAVALNPVSLQVKTTPPQPGPLDATTLVRPGDFVRVIIQRHALNVNAVYRIARMTINPDHTLDLTLNLRAP